MWKIRECETMNVLQTSIYPSPCGPLWLGSYEGKLCLCDWANGRRRDDIDRRLQHGLHVRYEKGETDVIREAARQLDDYFQGRRLSFSVPLLLVGTDFQKAVWQSLSAIPYGQTGSYAEVARRIGSPRAIRAVANANGVNALSLFLPCHRVVGSDGALTGYGGGVDVKKFLLDLECRVETSRG